MSAQDFDRHAHWDSVYTDRDPEEVSWYQAHPSRSLRMVEDTDAAAGAAIIDVGGGASTLVDHLLADGYRDLSVLDISAQALSRARQRLGHRASLVHWIEADITAWAPERQYELWHDRAVFHFLTDPDDRNAYLKCLRSAVPRAGHVIIATFAPDGPEKCSGLVIQRYSPEQLAQVMGDDFQLVETDSEAHHTPAGKVQHFQYSRFLRVG